MCFHLRGQAVPEDALLQQETTIQAGLILDHGHIPEKVAQTKIVQLNTEFPLKTVHFLGVRGLTSSYTVHNYTTCGHTDL
jgi:hypothetical protein